MSDPNNKTIRFYLNCYSITLHKVFERQKPSQRNKFDNINKSKALNQIVGQTNISTYEVSEFSRQSNNL